MAAACYLQAPPTNRPSITAVVQDDRNPPERLAAAAFIHDHHTARPRRCQPRLLFTTAAAFPPDSLGYPSPDRPPPVLALTRHDRLIIKAVSRQGRRLP